MDAAATLLRIRSLQAERPDGWRKRAKQLAHNLVENDETLYVPPEDKDLDEMTGRRCMPHCWPYQEIAREQNTFGRL